MKHFTVLLVDDNSELLAVAKKEFANAERIRLFTARSQQEAEQLIREHFFHIALIDPRLDPHQDFVFDGFNVLRLLKDKRPSCERLIITGSLDDAPDAIARQFHPIEGAADGLVNKRDPERDFPALIAHRSNRWLGGSLEIVGAETVARQLLLRFDQVRRRTRSKITPDEVDALASAVFGQGDVWSHENGGLDLRQVHLQMIPQGFSAAAVCRAHCVTFSGERSIECILKFAAREYVERELQRYSRFVRYRLEMYHRVELLGHAFADNLGVLCYNFAGTAALSTLFPSRLEDFLSGLRDLMSPGKKGWYSAKGQPIKLARFFKEHFGVDLVALQPKMRQIADVFCTRLGGVVHKHRVEMASGQQLLLPPLILEAPLFQDNIDSCIVHGDLHCDNIIVGEGNRPVIIDYYSVAYGPRAIDFGALECSVRMMHCEALMQQGEAEGGGATDGNDACDHIDDEKMRTLLALEARDVSVWHTVWNSGPIESDGRDAWEKATTEIGKLARVNFSGHSALSSKEYAAICMMWALRLFKVAEMPTAKCLRLLVWMSALGKILGAR